MKLVKLSLAAIIAAGALTSVASATSLEEAIKNVEVTGYARYRYDNIVDKFRNYKDNISYHRFTSDIDFKAAIDDSFFGVIGFRYDSVDNSGERTNARTMVGQDDNGYDNFGQTFNVRQFYLGYTAGNTTIQAGRQLLGTFFTDDMVGTGIKVLNSDISGLTLAAMAFDNLQDDTDIYSSFLNFGKRDKGQQYVYDNNLYSAAVIGSYDPVSFQLWYAAIDSVAQLYVADATLSGNLGGVDLSLQAQVAGSSVWAHNASLSYFEYNAETHKYVESTEFTDLDDAIFLATELSAKVAGFDASVGYIYINTNGNGASLISFEDQGSFITAGEDLLNYSLIEADQNTYFITAGYTFADKVRIGADYIGVRADLEEFDGKDYSTEDIYEAVARVDYKYSKKLNFKAWYSYTDGDLYSDIKHLRVEARYNF